MSAAPNRPPSVQPPRQRMVIARFADAAKRLNEGRALVQQIRSLADDMAATRLVPVGAEQLLAGELEEMIQQADDHIADIARGAVGQPGRMAELEQLLDEPEWEVARATLEELIKKHVDLSHYTKRLSEERLAYRLPLMRFRTAIERGYRLGLRIKSRDRKIAAECEGGLRASDGDFAAGRFDTLAVALERTKALLKECNLCDAALFEAHTKKIEARVESAEEHDNKLGRRAELFLISGSAVDNDVVYQVLLRRPNYPPIQETNLYQGITILENDQALFRETIDHIAASSIEGIRAAVDPSLRRARPAQAAPSTSADATVRLDDLGPDKRLEKIGRRMYSLLIPDAMQRLIAETSEFPLTITSNNPELPWELMHDGKEYLCLNRMLARMPAGQTFPRRGRDVPPAKGSQLRVLLINSAPAEELPQAESEITDVHEQLKAMGTRIAPATVIRDTDVTSARLTDELSLGHYDIVHYAGHAGFDAKRPERSYLLLPNGERFRADRVQRLLEGHPVVFLNACESSKAAPCATSSTGGIVAQAQGLASAFIYGGAQACVGSLWPVFDDTARTFAQEFYKNLIEHGQRVGEALRQARRRCRADQKDRVTWAAYALYGDPSYRLGADVNSSWARPAG